MPGYQVPAYQVFPNGKVELRGGVHKATSLVSSDFPFADAARHRQADHDRESLTHRR